MTRRELIAFAAALPFAACSTPPDQLKTDIATLAAGLGGILTALPGLPTDTRTKAQGFLDTITQNASMIASAAQPNPDTVAAIGSAVQALAAVLVPFVPQGAVVATVLQAALALVPIVLAMVGRPVAGAAATVTPDAARGILKEAAKRYGR